MPLEFSVSLKTTFLNTGTALAAPTQLLFPLVEFYGYNPQYMAQLYTLYRYAKITALSVRHTIINTGTPPVEFAIGVLPATEITGASPRNLSETPGGRFRLIGPVSGTCRSTLTALYPVEKYLGNVDQTSEYWVNSTQAANTVVINVNEPCHAVAINGSSSPFSYVLDSEITWHCQFFDLRFNQL
jgi:hypothetical protein